MKLVVSELITTLSQTVTITGEERLSFASIRPYIYMHNAPAGTFTLSVKSGAATLISKSFTSSEIKSDLTTTDDYAHLWKALIFDNPFQLGKGEYELELSSSGYSFSNTSYIGWVKEHENRFNDQTGEEVSDFSGPYSYQFLTYVKAK